MHLMLYTYLSFELYTNPTDKNIFLLCILNGYISASICSYPMHFDFHLWLLHTMHRQKFRYHNDRHYGKSVIIKPIHIEIISKTSMNFKQTIIKAEKNKEKEPKPRVRFRFLLEILVYFDTMQ